jgi:hypothetical protein
LGTIQWTRTIGGSSDDVGRDIIQNSNGDYFIAGYTESYGDGFHDVYFIKLNSSGTVAWSKVYGGGSFDFAYTVEETTDGGFVLGATTDSYGQGNMEAMMIKTDVNGTIQWAKAYGRSGEDRAQVARQTSDGGFVLAGRTNSFGGGNYDSYIIKTDASGNMEWDIAHGGGSWDQAWDISQMADNGYVVAGYTLSYGQGGRELFVYRTDAQGQSGCNESTSAGTVATSIALVSTSGGTSSSGGVTATPPTAIRAGTVTGVQCEQSGSCPESIFQASTSSVCQGDTVQFTNQSIDASSYQWLADNSSFSNATNTEYIFATGGIVTVSLIAIATGCNDTSALDISVALPPTVEAGMNQLVCTGGTVPLNGSYTNADGIEWSTGGTGQFNDVNITNPIYSPSIDDQTNGTVTLYLTSISASNPCPAVVDSVIITIDECVGINSAHPQSLKAIRQFDLLGRPIKSNHSGLYFVLFEDGSFIKRFRCTEH